MIQYDETRLAMEALTPQIEELKGALNLEGLKIKVDELEMKSTEPKFWDDPEKAQAVQQQIGQYKNTIDSFNRMKTNHDDVLAMIELAEEENDESAVDEVKELAEKVKSEFEEQKLATLLTGEYDSSNAILTFHAGAGGTEAQDWVSMLLRMYMKWADRHGFKTEILDMLDGEEAGIKSASIHIQGFNAYGFLKSENGVHRLVRVSPFDAQGRRHTSFASVEVMPEIEKDVSVEIRDEDIIMEVFRASGAGGQHINKTSSAVRLIHLPTNTVVECQQERSQVQNREKAMRILYARLYQAQQEAQAAELSAEKRSQVGMGMRNEKIRTYNFPQSRVTDHRIGLTLYKLGEILDGNLDEIIDALITADQAEKLQHSQESDTL